MLSRYMQELKKRKEESEKKLLSGLLIILGISFIFSGIVQYFKPNTSTLTVIRLFSMGFVLVVGSMGWLMYEKSKTIKEVSEETSKKVLLNENQ